MHFPDMRAERNWLALKEYPKLKDFCYTELDLDFRVLDMRWGITDDATNDHVTEQLCLAEIANCQRLSLGPSFVVSKRGDKSNCTGKLVIRAHCFESQPGHKIPLAIQNTMVLNLS